MKLTIAIIALLVLTGCAWKNHTHEIELQELETSPFREELPDYDCEVCDNYKCWPFPCQ